MASLLPKAPSVGEETFAFHLRVHQLPEAKREYRFHPTRLWRFDFAWPDRKLAVEVEGGTRSRGRHSRHDGFTADCEKYNAAALMGWVVLRFTTAMVVSGAAINAVISAVER